MFCFVLLVHYTIIGVVKNFLHVQIREHVIKNKFAFFADASAKALTPPRAVSGHSDFMQFFLHIYMFLKQKKPKMHDFVRKTNFGSKG